MAQAAALVSTNIHRRHLTESQRAMIAAELATLGEGRPGKTAQICAVSQGEAADALQVSRRSVQTARQVQESAPDLAAKVKAGEIKVSRAAAMAKERTKPQTDPDLAADSVIDATEARHAEGLHLTALLALALSVIGVAAVMRARLHAHLETLAVLRICGATLSMVGMVFIAQA